VLRLGQQPGQCIQADGFNQMFVDPGFPRALPVGFLPPASHRDDAYRGPSGLASDETRCGKAIDLWHPNVHKYNFGMVAAHKIYCIASTSAGHHCVALQSE
jgi:hypothetical protein